MTKRIQFVLATALAASAFAWGGLVQAATPAITQQDCNDAWNDAQASVSCTTTTLTAINPSDTPDGNLYLCDVSANCATTAGGQHSSSSSFRGVPWGGVDDLVNCSGALASQCSAPSSIIGSGDTE